MEKLYQAYKDRAEFLLVYIREAHPDSVLYVSRDGEESLEKVEQTDSLDARASNAQICCETLKLSFPAVLDREDNAVNEAYSGWPDRFVIIGTDGRIAYYGPPGPAGFMPNEVEEWLDKNTEPGASMTAQSIQDQTQQDCNMSEGETKDMNQKQFSGKESNSIRQCGLEGKKEAGAHQEDPRIQS